MTWNKDEQTFSRPSNPKIASRTKTKNINLISKMFQSDLKSLNSAWAFKGWLFGIGHWTNSIPLVNKIQLKLKYGKNGGQV